MKGSRRVLFLLMVALVALSAPATLPAHEQRAAPQSIVPFGGGSAHTDGNCHIGTFCGS